MTAERPAPRPLGSVAILGLGLMGGSLGMALRSRRAAAQVVGWNRSEGPALRAREAGAVDRLAASPQEAAREAELVVVALPVDCIVETAKSVAAAIGPTSVVTDVGSVKARIVAEASEALGGRFVGGHPMAGSEESGIGSACASLYEGAPWVITPAPRTEPSAVESVVRLAGAVGGRPVLLSPEVHDRWVAAVSHLPHVAAYAMAAAAYDLAGADGLRIAAGSYRDGTRVALSDPSLWAGILMENREAVLVAMERLAGWLDQATAVLREGDRCGLERLLQDARNARPRCQR